MSPSTDTRENRELASEMKVLVSPARAGQILAWARQHLSPDPHAGGPAGDGYQITSLYFDTAQFDVFHRRLLARALSPTCQIAYRRTALVAMTSFGPIRLTMDSGLRALGITCIQFSNEFGAPLLEDQIILELKFRYGMPALFKYLLEEFALTPVPFSKYRFAAAALGFVNAASDTEQISQPQYA